MKHVNILVRLFVLWPVHQNSQSVTRHLVEDNQTNSLEPVDASSDVGRCQEPAESINIPRADDNKLSSLTETLNIRNGFHRESRDYEKTLDDVDMVNRKWSEYGNIQSRVDMKDIPTTTKNVILFN